LNVEVIHTAFSTVHHKVLFKKAKHN